ncbi:tryptophan-rich sensory protein [Pilimelia columellifera]|uniref:Tryptophan-rich sensory protein n=1 Tax=Pilimelia columellifera subsp. columellifera TaxID=706583 RepID=A0ABN3N690_9ACTN
MTPSSFRENGAGRSARVTRADRLRQVGVTVSGLLCVTGTLVGFGVIGTPVEASAGGAFADNATLLAPAGPAFSIWSLIYLGLGAYVLWQWRPAVASSTRHRRTGWLAAASMLLNAAWILVTQRGWLLLSVVVILALVIVLGLLVRELTRHPGAGEGEEVIVDGTFGAYLGWVCVAVCANIAAVMSADGPAPGEPDVGSQVIAVAVLVAVTALGAFLAWVLDGRLATAAAIAWGLAWIAVGRSTDEPRSTVVATTAVLAAVAVLVATIVARRRLHGTPRSPDPAAGSDQQPASGPPDAR